MPRRTLSEAEYKLILRIIGDAQHLFVVRNFGTWVEGGVAPQNADSTNSHRLDDTKLIKRLDFAQRLLGYERGKERFPPPLDTQLATMLRVHIPRK